MTQSHVFSDFLEPTTLAVYFLAAPLGFTLLYILLPHFTSLAALRRYPGPFWAGFTRLWLAKQARVGKRSEIVHKEHLKHGKFSIFLIPSQFSLRVVSSFLNLTVKIVWVSNSLCMADR